MRRRRTGLSLVEVLVAAGVLALLGIALMQLLSGGAESTARAGEAQLAANMTMRIVDRLVADGYDGLVPYVGKEGEIDLSKIGEVSDELSSPGKSLVADGLVYTARYRCDAARTGLVKITVELVWNRHGGGTARTPGRLKLWRLVAAADAPGVAP